MRTSCLWIEDSERSHLMNHDPKILLLQLKWLSFMLGLDVVTTISAIPTYKPAERIRQYNDLAQFLGDERAKIARAIWNRPLKTLYISDCGELNVTKPTLFRSLP